MRDPNRIPTIMNLITQIWTKQPDTRFNQLINNLQWEFINETGRGKLDLYSKEEHRLGILSFIPHAVPDLFYVEDGKFVEFLEGKLERKKEK